MPEHQVAERVDQPGDPGQRDEQRRQQAILAATQRRDGIPEIGEERVHSRYLPTGAGACTQDRSESLIVVMTARRASPPGGHGTGLVRLWCFCGGPGCPP